MKYEILMSTMNKKSISELKLEEKNISENCLIINQITDKNIELKNEFILEKNIRMLSFRESGLSKSRNRAIENCKARIGIITDDDIKFQKEIFLEVVNIFEKLKSDIMTFKFNKISKLKSKEYKKYSYLHDFQTIRKVSSVEIVLDVEKIKEQDIKFDERFGLGTEFNSGEENIFLSDCLKKGIEIRFYPKVILEHPDESSREVFNKKKFYGKGAIFKRIYNKSGIFYCILFCIYKYKIYRKQIGFIEALKSSIKGYMAI